MNAREEKRAAFNQQMNEWVSRQGLWFQLRHAANGQTVIARIARAGLRLCLFLIVAALIFWGYLIKRVETNGFRENIQSSIQDTLKSDDCDLGGIRKQRDIVSISSLDAAGGDTSFFHQLKARQLRMNMKLTDGLFGEWNAGGISIDALDMKVKAGGRDNANAASSFDSLFEKHGKFRFDWIEVHRASVRWGYSDNNRGSIRDSAMTIARQGDGWKMEFKGGTFSQNWLRDLKIKKMVAVCDKQGVHIKEAELLSGAGVITFKLNMGSGMKPQAAGIVTLKSIPMKTLLPVKYHDWIEGVMSGKGTISGSTNSQEGIVLELDLSLADGDVMVIRDRLPLLSALKVVDVYNSYRKVSFTEGGCHIRTGGNLLKISDVNMRAGDLLHLRGNITVRPPSNEEIAKSLNITDLQLVENVLQKNWKLDDDILESTEGSNTLAQAAKGVGSVQTDVSDNKAEVAEKVMRTAIFSERQSRHFDGLVKVGLKRDAFDKAPRLKEAYPMDESTGRIWIDAPLKGRLQTLTLELAQELYVLSRNRR